MEDLSPIDGSRRYPLTIANAAGLQDHRFLGQAVLPAVYAMEYLARTVERALPDVPLTSCEDVRFDKFLALPSPNIPTVEAFAEIEILPGDDISAVLLTRHVAAKSGMTRMKVHARTRFRRTIPADDSLPKSPAWHNENPDAYQLPVDRLYADMVPFGATFQNIVSPVWLRPEGAWAVVSGGKPGADIHSPRLGSPFPLDAALHAACAWSQRYFGRVAFPVAMQQREIRQQTQPGREYDACVSFRSEDGTQLIFDLWIHEREGRLCEFVRGLTMRDVSGGRLQPPAWVSDGK